MKKRENACRKDAEANAGEQTEEARSAADDFRRYCCRGEDEVDFDTYEWLKDEGATVVSEAEAEAAEYDNATAVSTGSVNGVDYAWYEATEESDGESYTTRTYIFDAGTDFVELVFWMDGDMAEAFVEDIVNSVTK